MLQNSEQNYLVMPRIYEEVKEHVKSKVVDLQQHKNVVALTTDMDIRSK